MNLRKNLFAKEHLTPYVRKTAARKIVSLMYMNGNYNLPAIQFALEYDFDNDQLSGYQKCVLVNIPVSRETALDIRQVFVEIYHDDEQLLAFLNKTLTDRYFKARKPSRISDKKISEAMGVITKANPSFFDDVV